MTSTSLLVTSTTTPSPSSTSSSTSLTIPTGGPLLCTLNSYSSIPNIAPSTEYCYIGSSNTSEYNTDLAMDICCGGSNLVSTIAGCNWCEIPPQYANGSLGSDVNRAFGNCLGNWIEGNEYGYGCHVTSAGERRFGVRAGLVVLGVLGVGFVVGL